MARALARHARGHWFKSSIAHQFIYSEFMANKKAPPGERLDIYRHSTAHIMAHAVKNLFGEVKLGIGPPIEDGFYYDFDAEKPFSADDLDRIEREMAKIIDADYPFERLDMDRVEAGKLFSDRGEPYKVEILDGIPDDRVSVYRSGDFIDLCRGPHLGSTGEVKAYKLLNVAGAYWRGDEKRKMLSRIYGTAFPDAGLLAEFLRIREEAKKRDHRKLGRQLDLFSFHPEAPDFPFYHPRGLVLYRLLVDFWREEHRKRGYSEIATPFILREELWHRSGHWDNYKEHMFFTEVDGESLAVKPMNCPGCLLLFKEKHYSYRDLPLRVAEIGVVHRRELSGVLHGMFRVQSFAIDDAHIFCLPSQLKTEIVSVIGLLVHCYEVMGFSGYMVELSTRPERSIGRDEDWIEATLALRAALDEVGISYTVNEGEGAFYGPKIDFHIMDCLKRSWQCGTIQVDFSMPERFDLHYVGSDGNKHRPAMIHRAVFGSVERFLAVLLEHYAGDLPLWLSPVQARVITVAERHRDFAQNLKAEMEREGLRVEVDSKNETVGSKIRAAELLKIPYMLVVGDREKESGELAVRRYGKGKQSGATIKDLIVSIKVEVNNK